MTTDINNKVIPMESSSLNSATSLTTDGTHLPSVEVPTSVPADMTTTATAPTTTTAVTKNKTTIAGKNGKPARTDGPPKKRTKASRACDQCRKKKIKCDYNELKGICQYCQRNNEKCSFERVPLKRGPSKGYGRLYKGNTDKNNTNNNTNGTLEKSLVAGTTQEQPSLINGLGINNSSTSSQGFNQVLLPPLSQYVSHTKAQPLHNNTDGVTSTTNNNNNNIDLANNIDNISTNRVSSQNNTSTQVGQTINSLNQQFWKVPYHEFPHQKRGSVDSLPSDLSMRNINIQEQLLYSTTQPINQTTNLLSANFNNNQPVTTPTMENHNNTNNTNNSTNLLGNSTNSVVGGRANSITGSNNSAYWSYFKTFNPTTADEDQDIGLRRTSSIPSLLRHTPNSIVMGPQQQQPPHPNTSQLPQTYPYSQFYQQPSNNTQQQQQQNPTSISSFGHYAGFQSRTGSVASEVMSPSTLDRLVVPSKPLGSSTQVHSLHSEKFITRTSIPSEKRVSLTSVSTITQSPKVGPIDTPTNNSQKQYNEINEASTAAGKDEGSAFSITSIMGPVDPNSSQNQQAKKDITRNIKNTSDKSTPTGIVNSHTLSMNSMKQPEAKRLTAGSNITSSSPAGTPLGNIVSPSVVYGQISDVELIDIYYEFIHTGFPAIPLNKKTLTDNILLINTQPISSIHELNNYVILWFRNSLELLVRLAIKRGNTCSLFDSRSPSGFMKNTRDNISSNHGTPRRDPSDGRDEKSSIGNGDIGRNDFFEIQTIFISALNECFQKIVDIHPKFRENKNLISPKIKIIYLSTFIILNYILSYVGYDNSFVLGMSVTIFNEFKLYKMLLVDEIPTDDGAEKTDISLDLEYSIIFKRLYILLIIFDSLQSCMFGGPKLLNIPITGAVDKLFNNLPESEFYKGHQPEYIEKWCVESDTTRLIYIIQGLNLGEFLTELSINRKSINGFAIGVSGISSIKWDPKLKYMENAKELTSVPKLFHKILLTKQNSIDVLIDLERKTLKEVRMETVFDIEKILTQLISDILQILTLILHLNPTNSINPDQRPPESIKNDQDENELQHPLTTTGGDQATPNDIYHKNSSKNITDNAKPGIISPFAISIIYELHNIISIINKLPTQLIKLVMKAEFDDSIKPHEVVVRLSNSMNEVVQITNLFNMIKPFKIFDTDLNERNMDAYNTSALIMRRKFILEPILNEGNEVLEYFIKSGWKLLDDSEFGWL